MSIDSQINYAHLSLDDISENLIRFANRECKENAPLYYQLCIQIAKDNALLKIAANVRFGQPIPNLFLSAVHYLLILNPKEELAQYYPTISKKSCDEIPFELFKSFVIQNELEITKIIQTKIVQTNVINRCSYLMPVFSNIMLNEKRPMTIIDIGTSAGLTMNWDLYDYNYEGYEYEEESSIIIYTDVIDSEIPAFPYFYSNKITKIGIDQNPIDLTDENEKQWLKALVWADHIERFQTMETAIDITIKEENTMIKASTVSEFEAIITKTPLNQTLIIYSTFTFYQFTKEMISEFWEMLDRIGKLRDLYFLSAEGLKSYLEKYNTQDMVVELTRYKEGLKTQKLVCTTNGHGNWIKWNNSI